MDQNSPQDPEQPAATSGNRWEPTNPDAPSETSAVQPTAAEAPAAVPPRRPTWLTRARAGVAGGAAAVLLAGGLGGFAIGRATAGPGDGDVSRQQGVPTGFDRDGDGFREGDGHGFPGGPRGPQLGQLPDGSQVPGVPGQDDGTQDDGTDGSDT